MKYFNLHQLNSALGITYANAIFGVSGIVAVTSGKINLAFILLIAAALCDVFDGLVARLKKQTPSQKQLGTIADSMADMVSFGVLPAVIFIAIVSLNWLTGIVAVIYVLAAIHRLVVFTGDSLRTSAPNRRFTGLPVVMGAVMLPVAYVLLGSFDWFGYFMTGLVLVLAVLFVSKLPILKPHGPVAYLVYLFTAGLLIAGLIRW